MGRKKSVSQESNMQESVLSPELQEQLEKQLETMAAPVAETSAPPFYPQPQLRNEWGLVKGVQYNYDEFGFVNWKSHVKDEHIVLSRNALARDGIDTETLKPEEVSEYKAKVTEDKLLIKLAGFRDVARLRGIQSVKSTIWAEGEKVVCQTTIEFIPNYETNNLPFSWTAVASASPDVVSPTFRPFLEAVASNRAFSRCIREALSIHIVGFEELNPNEREDLVPEGSPRAALEKKCIKSGYSFEVLKTFLAGAGIEPDENKQWNKFSDIPDKYCLSGLDLIKKDEMAKAAAKRND